MPQGGFPPTTRKSAHGRWNACGINDLGQRKGTTPTRLCLSEGQWGEFARYHPLPASGVQLRTIGVLLPSEATPAVGATDLFSCRRGPSFDDAQHPAAYACVPGAALGIVATGAWRQAHGPAAHLFVQQLSCGAGRTSLRAKCCATAACVAFGRRPCATARGRQPSPEALCGGRCARFACPKVSSC